MTRWLALGMLLFCSPRGTAEARPNIVLVVLDDQHYADFGRSSANVRTPNLDRIAQAGWTTNSCYVEVPVCRPSLAGVLTGRPFWSTGAHTNYTPITAANSLTLLLSQAGYRVHTAGKWWEAASGFGVESHAPTSIDTTTSTGFARADHQVQTLDFIADCAAANDPFFVWWAPKLPHWPHAPPGVFADLFPTAGIQVPTWFAGSASTYRAKQAAYLAMVAWTDSEFGRLVGHLHQVGAADNTLIVILADNGWITGLVGKGGPYDAGTRTALTFWLPGIIEAMQHERLTTSLDIMPTLLEYAETPVPGAVVGESLKAELEGAPTEPENVVYGACYPHDLDQHMAAWLRTPQWKYVRWTQNVDSSWLPNYRIYADGLASVSKAMGQEELYAITTDPYELVNVAASQPDAMAEVRQLMADWWGGTGYSPLPTAQIVDDTHAGFAIIAGTWGTGTAGYLGGNRHAPAGTGAGKSRWTLLTQPGVTYQLYATWYPHPNRATNAKYRFAGQVVSVNQEQAPADFTDMGVAWHILGTVTAAGGTLAVELWDDGNEYVIADAVRLEPVP